MVKLTCLFIVAIALVTPFMAWAIVLLALRVCIFKDTAWMFALREMNFLTYLRVRTKSLAMILTASCIWKKNDSQVNVITSKIFIKINTISTKTSLLQLQVTQVCVPWADL